MSHPSYRPDIDGLRAIAILSVVLFHAFPAWLPGGFIGVDIFFVISGYLISTIIFSSLEKNSFSFIGFYSRRIDRIYPALLLVLIFCFVFGWFFLLADEYKQLGKHMAGGAAFISNYVLWSESGYFDNIAETKPLLHLWSLGIEEQFYIVWPILLWLAWKPRFNRITILFVIIFISFSLNIYGRHTNSTATFYSPQTRFWELLIGSVLAYFTLHKSTVLSRVKHELDLFFIKIIYENKLDSNGNTFRNVLSIFGLLIIIVGFVFITKTRSFPGWWAILPTFGAVFIIAAGSQAWFNRKVLSSRLMVWFGLISFPLYLWHWPLLSFARIIEAETPSFKIRVVAVVVSISLAWVTYQFLEKPLKKYSNNKIKTLVLFVLMIVVGYVGYNTYLRNGLVFRPVVKNLAQKQLDLQPYALAICDDKKFEGLELSWCSQSKNKEAIDYILWGDSHAEHIFQGLKQKSNDAWMLIGRHSCPPLINVRAWDQQSLPDTCKNANDMAMRFIKEHEAPVIVLASLGAFYIESKTITPEHKALYGGSTSRFNLENESGEKNKNKVFEKGLQDSVNTLLSQGKKIILIKDVPEFIADPKACLSRPLSQSKKCGISKEEYVLRTKIYDEILNNVKNTSPHVYLFDAAALFCDDKECSPSDNEHIYYRDGHHLSTEGGNKVAKALVDLVEKIK